VAFKSFKHIGKIIHFLKIKPASHRGLRTPMRILIYLHCLTHGFLPSFEDYLTCTMNEAGILSTTPLCNFFFLPFKSCFRAQNQGSPPCAPSDRARFLACRRAWQASPLTRWLSQALQSTATHCVPTEGFALSSESCCYLQQTAVMK